MVTTVPGFSQHISLLTADLLGSDESILIVDDDAAIRRMLVDYLGAHGLPVREAHDAATCWNVLEHNHIALVLLDIRLPDADGLWLLPELIKKYPGLTVVMLSGVAELQVAIECIRNGAEDYIAKPLELEKFLLLIRKVLEKRRLTLENYKYQEELEMAHFRIRFLHQLSLKMNTAYLSTLELDEILQAILVGITAEEGLRFNRAFLALFDEEGKILEGRMAIGTRSREQAGRIWSEMKERQLHDFIDIVHNLRANGFGSENGINEQVKKLRVPLSDTAHILIRAVTERRSILVVNGRSDVEVTGELLHLLGDDTFLIVPLYSHGQPMGVIIADNFVTRQPIAQDLVSALELFASQASLAIEQSRLYMVMQKKIEELEELNLELDRNKDLLVEAGRYAALGQMAAQLVHSIRNPVTSIGGVARLLAKRTTDEEWLKFINMMVRETARLESILDELFDFVGHESLNKEMVPLYPLIRKTVMLVQPTMNKQKIELEFDLPDPEPVVEIDIKQIKQMFLHLIKNSVEAMMDGGRLTVSVGRENGWIRLTVADTGPGLADFNFKTVANPFFTTKTYGTGLGLTLVERVAQAHGGSFSLQRSEEAGCTEAVVLLPLPQ